MPKTAKRSPVSEPIIDKRKVKAVETKKERDVVTPDASGIRRLKLSKRIWNKPRTWRNHEPITTFAPLPKARVILWNSLSHMWDNKVIYGGLVLIYGFLNIVLVHGLSNNGDFAATKKAIDSIFQDGGGMLASGFTSFGYLLTNSASDSANNSSPYQGLLPIIFSLAIIWALRQTYANHPIRIRDTLYLGMYPFVQYLLLFALLAVQLIPLVASGTVYQNMITGGIAIHFWEQAVTLAVCVALALWSLSMLTTTIFSLYVVTLPDMTPLKAHRSAKRLVYGRRLYLWRKLIFLPVVMALTLVIIELPIILFVTVLAPWSLFALSMLALPVVHAYLYSTYRDML